MSDKSVLEKPHYRLSEIVEITGLTIDQLYYMIETGDLQTDGRFGVRPKSPHRVSKSEVQRIVQAMAA